MSDELAKTSKAERGATVATTGDGALSRVRNDSSGRTRENEAGLSASATYPRRSHQQRQDGVQYQYPVCFVCGVDVEAFAWSDHQSRDGVLTRTFFCMCHGATETTSRPLDEMRSGQMAGFQIGVAFMPDEEPPQHVDVELIERPALNP